MWGNSSFKSEDVEGNFDDLIVGELDQNIQLGVLLKPGSYCHSLPEGLVLGMGPVGELAGGEGTGEDFVHKD